MDAAAGRALHYNLVTSSGNPTTDPLVTFWNGGPGCSSDGSMWTETGPYIVQADNYTLELNPYSWNTVANMLWIESPAGVGYSYSNTTSDLNTDDVRTAADALAALVIFYQKYPELVTNDLFVTGESYAGHYVPELAA